MKTSNNGIQFIEKEEGVILYAYDDANEKRVPVGGTTHGTITIGTGHTSAAGAPKVVPGMTITKAQADSILASDLSKVEAQVNNLVKVSLTQNQFDALVSFQFNTGGLGRASVLTKLNKGDYAGAADALLLWSKANGNPTLLLPRRKREKALFLSTAVVKQDKVSGPVAGPVAALSFWAILNNYIHTHPYLTGIAAIAVGAMIWYVVHTIRNRK